MGKEGTAAAGIDAGATHRVARFLLACRPLRVRAYALTVASAQVLETLGTPDPQRIRTAYDGLVSNEEFQRSYTRATADEASVNLRIQMAADCFAAR